MKKCRECKSEIASDAKRCPNCKAKQGSWFRRHPVLTVLLVLFVIGIIGSAANGGSKSSTTSNSAANNQTNVQADQPTATSVIKAPEVSAEYTSALNKATLYATTMSMSKKGVYDQLVSPAGEKFSAAAAQYAVDNVKADWNANALAKAKTYQSQMSMSPSAIHDQLTSDAGEKFTQAEADYAIQHLNK